MFRRSFVSVYFLPNKLLIVQLSSNKKKVKKFASIDLPRGLVDQHKVRDKDSLVKLLKATWSKLEISEKSVGIVLSEFSSFTKLFKLPSLSLSDLDEAVRWQTQEYLPEIADMIMDWKIVERKETGFEVLMVAVEKDVLRTYIDIFESAGLFPLLVEIPSLCLTKLSKSDSAKIIIYESFEEAILVISSGEKIIGSSILHSPSSEEIVRSISRMLSHFSGTKIETVEYCGDHISEDLLVKLKQTFKIPIAKITPQISGFQKDELQKFMIPVSDQFQNPLQPNDPFTLNLLPGYLVERYERRRLRVQLWGLTLTITLFVWICFLVSLVSYLFLTQRLRELSVKVSSQKQIASEREEAIKTVDSINQISEKVSQIKKVFVSPEALLNQINASRPEELVINKYSLDFDKGQVNLFGVALNRSSLISFKQNLEKIKDVSSVDIPISNFEKEVNLEFSLNLNFQESLRKSSIPSKTILDR